LSSEKGTQGGDLALDRNDHVTQRNTRDTKSNFSLQFTSTASQEEPLKATESSTAILQIKHLNKTLDTLMERLSVKPLLVVGARQSSLEGTETSCSSYDMVV